MRAALRLIWTLDVRHLLGHRARLALSALGIAAGVGLGVSVAVLGSSIDASLRAIADAAASDADLEVRPSAPTGLPGELISEVRTLEGVDAAGATVESNVVLRAGERTRRTLLLGVDQGIADMSPRAVNDDALRGADILGLFLPQTVADELGVGQGDVVEITTPDGWREIGVGAVLGPETTGRTTAVVALIGVAQDLLGRGTRVDAIYVDASDPEATLPRLADAVSDVGYAGPIAFRSGQVEQLFGGAATALNVATLVALAVGAFLVYNTMSMAAVERLREAATMRAVGAKRRQVFALFLAEGALVGVVGSIAGVVGGLLLARVTLSARGSALEEVIPVRITDVTADPALLVAAGVAGVAAAVLAAYLPARRVARSDPAAALGPAGALEDPTRVPRRSAVVVGILLAAAGVPAAAIAFRAGRETLAMAGMVATLGGIALLIPTGVPLVARLVLGPSLRKGRSSGIFRLAASEVLRSPGRTSFTVGAVLLALSLVIGFSVVQGSFRRAFDTEFENILAADLYVRSATWRTFGSDVPVRASLAEELAGVPGVIVAYPFRIMPATLGDDSILIITYDFEGFARLPGLRGERLHEAREWVRASEDEVFVSQSFPSAIGAGVGESFELPTPTGRHTLRIAGVFPDPAAVTPEVFVDYGVFVRIWGSATADTFPVGLTPGADPAAVTSEIERRFGDIVDVSTGAEYRDELSALVGSVTGLISSVQFVAVLVAGLGLANTLLISTLERRRDFGVLRAVGMRRRQMQGMVATEAVLLGALGVVLAWGLGTVIGLGMHAILEAQLGLSLPRAIPWPLYGGVAVLGVAGAALAALYPAWRAARVDVVEALQYE